MQAPARWAGTSARPVGRWPGFFSPAGISDFADNVGRKATTRAADSGSSVAAVSNSDDNENRLMSILGVVQLGSR